MKTITTALTALILFSSAAYAAPSADAALMAKGKTVYEKLKTHGFLVRYFDGADTGDFVRITIGTAAQMNMLADTIKKL